MTTPDAVPADAPRPTEQRHLPVLRDRCLELLAPAFAAASADGRTPVYVDGTLGMGGHAEAVLETFPDVRVVGIDRDTEALGLAAARLKPYGDRVTYVHAVYDELPEVLDDLGLSGIDGALYDLGVSSLQLDEAERGFAYSQDAPLDMRMDQSAGITAAEVLNTYAPGDLVRVLRDFGEERFAPRIVSAIVRRREVEPWARSGELVDLVRDNIPAATRRTGGNPAKRTFQALRIEVNQELAVLQRAIPAAVEALVVGGRLLIESYQSLEDRIVKRALAGGLESTAPPGLPVEPTSYMPYLRALTRGAEEADAEEIERNPRSASVRLRGVERLRPTPDHVKSALAQLERERTSRATSNKSTHSSRGKGRNP